MELRDMLAELGARSARLGIQLEAYDLTAARGLDLVRALDGLCALEDASTLVIALGLVKRPAESTLGRGAPHNSPIMRCTKSPGGGGRAVFCRPKVIARVPGRRRQSGLDAPIRSTGRLR